jgi:nucleolar pre-ribosomal-associated protein 1
MENILPSLNTKNHFSKGLQSISLLVQHCTALALSKCLLKYAEVIRAFQSIARALEEDEDEGQWCRRRQEIEKEARKRVPDFQVVVAFAQQTASQGALAAGRLVLQPNATTGALMAESAQRLLLLYHQCLPSMVAEARFDVGKLLQNFLSDTRSKTEEGEGESMYLGVNLHAVRRLHVLRLLKESDQFIWSGKPRGCFSHRTTFLLNKSVSIVPIQLPPHPLEIIL